MTPMPEPSDQETLNWLRLARTPRIGPVTFQKLISRHTTATKALASLTEYSVGRRQALVPMSESAAHREIELTKKVGARLVLLSDPEYPSALKALSSPPPILSVIGDLSIAQRPTIAIVGARNASAAGLKLAKLFAHNLGNAGVTIASGLARGIDGAAHAASLSTGTIAVLGGGVDHIYPRQHDHLYRSLAEKGLIVSESPVGHQAQAKDFPRRNRIITGLSLGVVIIEAAERSGSLISARTAGEQGREVMVVPGSPLDLRCSGSNRLIRDGATLVRHAEDVLEAVSPMVRTSGVASGQMPLNFAASEPERYDETPPASDTLEAVRAILTNTPLSIDEIASSAGIAVQTCAAALVELELDGRAETLPGGLACLL